MGSRGYIKKKNEPSEPFHCFVFVFCGLCLKCSTDVHDLNACPPADGAIGVSLWKLYEAGHWEKENIDSYNQVWF